MISCVHVLGAHVPARRWLPLCLDHLASQRLSVAQKANALVVLAGLLHSAGSTGQVCCTGGGRGFMWCCCLVSVAYM